MLYKEKDIMRDSIFKKKYSSLVSGIKLFELQDENAKNSDIIDSTKKLDSTS